MKPEQAWCWCWWEGPVLPSRPAAAVDTELLKMKYGVGGRAAILRNAKWNKMEKNVFTRTLSRKKIEGVIS